MAALLVIGCSLLFGLTTSAVWFVWESTPERPVLRTVLIGLTVLAAIFTGAVGGGILRSLMQEQAPTH